MQLAQLRRPVQAAALSTPVFRPTFALPIRPAISQPSSLSPSQHGGVDGKRYASVKAQGAYRVPNKKTIAKKLGAKRTGDQYVIPGNIIYKQRGTIWHAGENAIRGRDHTIHAAVEGYVKYYRDPDRHPEKQYIGVAFNKEDTLPYPRNEPRRRKLNMVAVPRKVKPKREEFTASGLPKKVTIPGNEFDMADLERKLWKNDQQRELREAGAVTDGETNGVAAEEVAAVEAPTTREEEPESVHPLEFIQKRWLERRRTRTLHFNKANYSYAESNAAIGRLVSRTMYTPPWKLGGRKSRFRARRKRREKELAQQRKEMAEGALKAKEKKVREEKKRAARLAKQIAAGAGKKAEAQKVDGPVEEAKPAEGQNESKPE